jgi:Secretion system C-terminal sorting domain
MKKAVFLLLFVSAISVGQCLLNGTITNPLNPKNPQFPNYLNHFDWENTTDFKYNTTAFRNTYTPNPFFSNQPLFQNIALLKDYKSENGWETIAYNLGYDNNNNVLLSPPQHAYFMLYNKYRGILRVLVKWSGLTESANRSQLSLEFANGLETNLLDMASGEKALLSPHTPGVKYSTFLTYFNDSTNWAYADFKLNYDPCTCLAPNVAALNLKTYLIKESTINITGAINGTITSIKSGQGTDKSSGKAWNTINNVGNKFISTSKSIESFVKNSDTIFKKLKDKGITINAITKIADAFKENKFLKGGLAAAPYVGEGLKFVSALFGGGAGATGPTELAPMSVNLAVKLDGTITTSSGMHNLNIGLPGSGNSAALPGIAGGQPLYNETLGVFSLLDEPTMYYTENTKDIVEDAYDYYIFPRITSFLIKKNNNKFRFINRNYKMDGSRLIRYAINPASNLELQDAQFMIIPEYYKPSLGYNSSMPNSTVLDPVVDVDTDNGLAFNINSSSIAQNTGVFNVSSVGNAIDLNNKIFQNSFPPIGEKYFDNNYQFSFLYDVQKLDKNNYFDFGCEKLTDKGIIKNRVNYFVKPKPEYLAPRVKSFSLKIILNLKRTDNPNAQNVLYVATYPIKLVPAPAGMDMNGSDYASAAQNYINGGSTIDIPRFNLVNHNTDGRVWNSICGSNEYTKNRMKFNASKSADDKKLVVGESEPQNKDLVYSPNPVEKMLSLKLNNSKITSIVAIDGKILRTFDIESINKQQEAQLDFNSYPQGVYFINYLDADNKAKTAKIIKE